LKLGEEGFGNVWWGLALNLGETGEVGDEDIAAEAVGDELAVAGGLDKAGGFELFHVMGDGGGRDLGASAKMLAGECVAGFADAAKEVVAARIGERFGDQLETGVGEACNCHSCMLERLHAVSTRIDWNRGNGACGMADVAELQERFGIDGVLRFETAEAGLIVVQVTAPAAEATIYLHGAHVTHWKPTGHASVIFVSKRAEFLPGKPIRGGVPVIFPWFGERHDGKAGPQHGFARTNEWELAFAAMAGEELTLVFTLGPNDLSRSLGFDAFRLSYRVTIGRTLTMELTVANDANVPLEFEEALHTYFAVADARRVAIHGLGETEYIDKVDGMKRKVQPAGALRLEGRTDRLYLNTETTCVLHDPAGGRRIVVAKSGSRSTVVWNPWEELTAKMADMEPDAWLHMTCVETVNAGDNAVKVGAGETHSMRATVSVEAE
jgi:glucose-6-phosphate 1-epimerase